MSNNDAATPLSISTQELEWVKIKEELTPIGENELFTEKLKRVAVNYPLIPLGILATCGSLVYGLRSMVKGERRNSQMAMRYRVFFQAVTVAAMAISSLTMMNSRKNSSNQTKQDST